MRSIDRLALLEEVGKELQSRMTFAEIDIFFAGFGIDGQGITPTVNSKRVYVKQVLAKLSDELILRVADELGVQHSYHSRLPIEEGKFWEAGHFRLFLSHISAFKERTALLQRSLRPLGISAFVAHEDIEPTKEWLLEIEKALYSMDALAAILTPKFNESQWTDHEVGIAIGRDKLVIPIRKGMDPYGFIGKYQGLQGQGKSVQQVARMVFDVLATNMKTRDLFIGKLIDLVLLSTTADFMLQRLDLVLNIPIIPRTHLERLKSNAQQQSIFHQSEEVLKRTNQLLAKHGVSELRLTEVQVLSDEVPF